MIVACLAVVCFNNSSDGLPELLLAVVHSVKAFPSSILRLLPVVRGVLASLVGPPRHVFATVKEALRN